MNSRRMDALRSENGDLAGIDRRESVLFDTGSLLVESDFIWMQ